VLRHLVGVLGMGCVACGQEQPIATTSLIGRWEFVRANNIVGQGDSADGMHIGFLIMTARGDSVFGKVYMYSDEHPENADSCGSLRGVHDGRSRLTLAFEDKTGKLSIAARLRQDTLLVDHLRSTPGTDAVPWGSWLIFTRRGSTGLKGCLTRA